MTTTHHSGPLAGIRIVDLTAMISGPLATMILGDQGADVIKVEAPGMGDPMRMFGAISGGVSSTFVNMNRSKRTMTLDLRTDEGKGILRKLCDGADVFIQNFRPGVAERMGFGYEAVQAISPDIIYLSISGFGDTGPMSKRPVYDNIVQAISGMASVQANPETGEPELVRNLSLDKATAYTAAQAVTAALLARERRRGGQHVRIAMLDVALAFLWPDGMMNHTFLGEDVMRIPPFSTIYRVYATADGAMTISALTDEQWINACRAADRQDLIDDPRFSSIFGRMSHTKELLKLVTEMIASKTTAEWCALYEQHDVPHALIVPLDDVHTHPQVQANASLRETQHPTAGPLREALPAPRFSATPASPQGPAPMPGEHTDSILAELGYGGEAIASMRERGTVA